MLPTVRVPDHWDPRLRPGQLSLGSGAVITTRGLDSAIRGVLVGTKRPDLVILDDPESARLGPQRRPDGPPRPYDRGGAGRTGRPRQAAGPRHAHHDDEQLQPLGHLHRPGPVGTKGTLIFHLIFHLISPGSKAVGRD